MKTFTHDSEATILRVWHDGVCTDLGHGGSVDVEDEDTAVVQELPVGTPREEPNDPPVKDPA